MIDFCCVGHITLDTVITPHLTQQMAGGTAFYFSHAMHALGTSCQLVTKLNKAEHRFVDELSSAGIAVSATDSAHTVHFENCYGEQPDLRTQRVLAQADSFGLPELNMVQAPLVHLGPLLQDDMDANLILFLSQKARLSLDIQGFLRRVENEKVVLTPWAQMTNILPYIEFLKLNEMESEQLTGQTNVAQAAERIAHMGVREVIITLGSKGAVIWYDNQLFSIPAYTPIQALDATGCGDTFMAGYLYQRLQGSDIETAGHFASAMASIKIATLGAFKGTLQMVEHHMRMAKPI